MLSLILFILIGIKLDMMDGLYLGLVIIYTIFYIVSFIFKIIKLILEAKDIC